MTSAKLWVSRGRPRRRIGLVGLLALAGLFAPGGLAAAAPATTDPGQGKEYVFVKITDSKIVFTTESAYCCDGPKFTPGTPRAWATLSFRVTNVGKKPHNFSLLGKSTKPIRPGATVNSKFYNFNLRGKFIYKSTVNPGPGLRGYWLVY
jgi:hypothetical protein